MNQRGSSSVFLVMILAGMIAVTMTFISVSKRVASISCSDDLMHLAGRSVLSEYDRGLKKAYGLFAFRGQQVDIAERMGTYLNTALEHRDDMDLTVLRADISEYTLLNIDRFEQEILKYTRFAMARNLIHSRDTASGGSEGKAVNKEKSDRILRNQSVIQSLPSGMLQERNGISLQIRQRMAGASDALRRGGTSVLMNQYIMSHFKTAQNQEIGGRETFFRYETEYLIAGKRDDNKNRNAVRREVILLRHAINFSHVLTDPDKQSELATAAQAIAPGPAGLAVQLALAEGWALAEAENDMRLLEHGRKVPLLKTAGTWAVKLSTIVKHQKEKYIDTHPATGLTYDGYLQLYLLFMPREVKYARMMDLMQINLQGTEDRTFLFREHQFGFWIQSVINGRTFSYEQKY